MQYVYVGQLYRNLAAKHGMGLVEFGKYCETHPEVDKQLDDSQLEVLKAGDVILEGRITAWLAVKNDAEAFKVFITAEERERARRVAQRDGGDIDEQLAVNRERERSEAKRYSEYYDIDILDLSIYDIIVDSTNNSPEELRDMVVTALYGGVNK